jgi:hypothetical protein
LKILPELVYILISLLFYDIYIYVFLLPILGLTNPTPLNRNFVLEICMERVYNHAVSKHMHKQKSQHDAYFISNTWGQLDLIIPPTIVSHRLLTKVTFRSYI